jgi:hypothetical protein
VAELVLQDARPATTAQELRRERVPKIMETEHRHPGLLANVVPELAIPILRQRFPSERLV